ncbi:MAG: pseudaminic acid biosynthesis-associated methylase [Parvibaculum sp.]|uniref:pseudaminic acid biosynthesis-associated methylase n=1 Tax=Parvibaculum sp. TaxID=2024848 RepID=UPI00271A5897|nr:pseudaminic acid biosynthesis-associated methylase [Parvibaculum sp.]MDO8838139.1 pseudaminic acid biosynthesis-associated methylase [Parvibaculum sp.]
MAFQTEQERFWTGSFGDEYIDRNQGEHIVTSNLALFARILKSAPDVKSIVELGCNIGLNLQALKRINAGFELCGYEINETAASTARALEIANIVQGTILEDLAAGRTYDLAFTKTVLIHINPGKLDQVYRNLHALSSRYVLVCEYYNPSPMVVTYRGNEDRLFKRDFAGEIMDKFGMRLLDYGFVYHRDNYFPQDDITWFLLEK